MPVTASTSKPSAKHANKVLDLSGKGKAPAAVPAAAPLSVEAVDMPATVKAHRQARFVTRHGHQGRYDEGLDVEVDRDDVQEVKGEAFANLYAQHEMKAAGTGASKVSPSYQSKPKSVRMR